MSNQQKPESYFIQRWNDLDNKTFKRKELIAFSQELYDSLHLQHTHLDYMYKTIVNLLESNPKITKFPIELKDKLKMSVASLNGLEAIKTIQGLGIPYFKKPIPTKHTGLNKKVSSKEIYDMITNKIIALIKVNNKSKSGKSWTEATSDYEIAYNFITKKPYKSVNQLILSLSEPLENPYFLTFKQTEKLKGKVKKGAKGYQVIYYTMLYIHQKVDGGKKIIGTYDENRFVKHLNKYSKVSITKKMLKAHSFGAITPILDLKGTSVSILPILKYYNVFNGADITGIDFDLANFDLEGKLPTKKESDNNIEKAVHLIKNYPKPVPEIFNKGSKAYYSPTNDNITMPLKKRFKTNVDYYTTLFHELSHSTGHKTRLKRDFTGRMSLADKEKLKKYAFEELIAELSAVFLKNSVGILGKNIKQNLDYLKHWNKILILILEKDNKFIFKASSKAQKSADYILQRDNDGTPLYLKKGGKNNVKVLEKKEKTQPKINKQGQYALLGVKNTPKKVFKKPISQPIVTKIKTNTIKLQSASQLLKTKTVHKHYDISKELKYILGNIEIKEKDSVAITVDAPQGAMKTRFIFQIGNEFARQGKKILFVSLEEHHTSKLFQDKLVQYVTPQNLERFYPISELENGYKTLNGLIPQFDVILVDSWNKIAEDEKGLDFDKDLRKKFNSKLFVTIFQRTTSGTMRGGSKSQFDGDVILKIKKFEDYKFNYVYQDKNRYMVGDYVYNIYEKKSYLREIYLKILEDNGQKPIN